MPAVISLRPKTPRGTEILDELEERNDLEPDQIISDGTRRYLYLVAMRADIDALDPWLDRIDPNWRDHVSNLGVPS